MLDMFLNSVKLFFAGKLFRESRAVMMQWLKGFALTLVAMLALGFLVSPLSGVVGASRVGGFIEPLLV